MIMALKQFLLSSFFLICLTGCGGRDATNIDVVGRWVHSDTVELIFKSNNTVIAKGLPLQILQNEKTNEIINHIGKWKLYKTNAGWSVEIFFEISSNEVVGRLDFMGTGFAGSSNDFKHLYITSGDLDSPDYYEFRKSK